MNATASTANSTTHKEKHLTQQVKQGRRNFVLVILVFILPIVIAKFALDDKWFNYGVTNKGKLLSKPVHLADLNLSHLQASTNDKGNENGKLQQQPWLLVFNMPTPCDSACENTLNTLKNTYIALGKNMPRITPVTISSQVNLPKKQSLPANWQVLNNVEKNKQLQLLPQVFVVDPLGNVVVTHQVPNEQEALVQMGKDIVADMYKLLKYSRIG